MDRATDLSPIDALRAATRPLHEQLDALPYARAVIDGTLPIALYGSFLHAVHTLHEALEPVLEHTSAPALRPLFAGSASRRGLLAQDLAFLRVDVRAVDAAQLRALVLAQRMRLDARHDARRLLGYAYVLEGSQLGGQQQAHALATRPELAAGGRAYLRGAGKATQSIFADFLQRLSAQLAGPSDLEQAIMGARAAFEGFADILATLDPERGSNEVGRWLVAELNEDAGTHPVPHDVREVQAALEAGERTYAQYAYYQARYGERGLRFTRSDSAWLATLAREDEESTVRHVLWLARTLCSRGMPRILLEQHLPVLQAALVARVPECASHYEALGRAAARLRAEREQAVSPSRSAAWSTAFVTAAEGATEGGIHAREAAVLLIAAVADEKQGIPGAVSALTAWLCDRARFSPAWVEACQQTVAAARQET